MSAITRSLIDDPDFQRRLASHASDRVPYFSQLRAPEPPGSPPPPLPPLPRSHSAPPASSRPRDLRPAGAGLALTERPRTAGAAEDPRLHGGPRHPDHHADGQAGGPGQSGGRQSIRRSAPPLSGGALYVNLVVNCGRVCVSQVPWQLMLLCVRACVCARACTPNPNCS